MEPKLETHSKHTDIEGFSKFKLSLNYALVAQLDRVLASEAKGHEFESHRAHHLESL